MIAIQKVTSKVQVSPASLQTLIDTRLTLTPSAIPNSNYIIMVSDRNCLKFVACFLYCNHKVHRDILITLYEIKRILSCAFFGLMHNCNVICLC
jgi:hypothetical protein